MEPTREARFDTKLDPLGERDCTFAGCRAVEWAFELRIHPSLIAVWTKIILAAISAKKILKNT